MSDLKFGKAATEEREDGMMRIVGDTCAFYAPWLARGRWVAPGRKLHSHHTYQRSVSYISTCYFVPSEGKVLKKLWRQRLHLLQELF